MQFRDRVHAGELLEELLRRELGDIDDGIVLGLPRGGVPVAAAVARRLGLPLDVYLVRKLGVPGHEEYAMGAIASGGVRVLNEDAVRSLGIDQATIDSVTERELVELERREIAYRGDRPALDLKGTNVILVDDGIATGASMRAAIEAVRAAEPASITVAVPVAPLSTCRTLTEIADRVVAVEMPDPFYAVGWHYIDFAQTT
ncbi:MAG: phosphoribosyltransferase, partial [Actinomycetia bacterium]|nr:phosphoribosyltransferase [Actinomycetes bacterium]